MNAMRKLIVWYAARGRFVELVEWRTAESEVSGSNLRARFQFSRNQFSITSGQGWLGPMLCTVKWVKKVSCGGVIALAVEQPQLFIKLPKTKKCVIYWPCAWQCTQFMAWLLTLCLTVPAVHGLAIDAVPDSARSSYPTEELLSVPGSDITKLRHYHRCPRQRFVKVHKSLFFQMSPEHSSQY